MTFSIFSFKNEKYQREKYVITIRLRITVELRPLVRRTPNVNGLLELISMPTRNASELLA